MLRILSWHVHTKKPEILYRRTSGSLLATIKSYILEMEKLYHWIKSAVTFCHTFQSVEGNLPHKNVSMQTTKLPTWKGGLECGNLVICISSRCC